MATETTQEEAAFVCYDVQSDVNARDTSMRLKIAGKVKHTNCIWKHDRRSNMVTFSCNKYDAFWNVFVMFLRCCWNVFEMLLNIFEMFLECKREVLAWISVGHSAGPGVSNRVHTRVT